MLEFDCLPGTRIIIQRPDGYFTALVSGTVRIVNHIETTDHPMEPDQMVGASITADLTAEEADDGTLYRLAVGEYPR